MPIRRYIQYIEQVTSGSLWHGTTVLNLSSILAVDTLWSIGEGISFVSDPMLASIHADDLTRKHICHVYPADFGPLPPFAEEVRGAVMEFDALKLRSAINLVPVDGRPQEWRHGGNIRSLRPFLRAVYVVEEDIQWCLNLVDGEQPYADELIDLMTSGLLLPRDYPVEE